MVKFDFHVFHIFSFFFGIKNIHFHILDGDLKNTFLWKKKLKKEFPVGKQNFFSTKLSGLFSFFSFFDKKKCPKLNYKVTYEVQKMTQKNT